MRIKEVWKLLKGCNDINRVIKKICGEKIGSGLYRDVYVLKQNPKYVVKIERDMSTGMFANVTEFRNYINNKEWDWFEQWLSPCEGINETGNCLIQKRITQGKRKDYPTHIPVMFTDCKLKNFGWIGKQFVCCDYSFLLTTFTNKKMKRAKWWNSDK